MKAITETSKKIAATKSTISKLCSEIHRAQSIVDGVPQYEAKLAQLHVERTRILADAFISSATAETDKIELQIKTTTSELDRAKSESESAAAAIPVLKQQMSAAEDDLSALDDAMKTAIAEAIDTEFTLAKDAYKAACDAIEEAIGKMRSIVEICKHVDGPSITHKTKWYAEYSFFLYQKISSQGIVDVETLNSPRWAMNYTLDKYLATHPTLLAKFRAAGAPL